MRQRINFKRRNAKIPTHMLVLCDTVQKQLHLHLLCTYARDIVDYYQILVKGKEMILLYYHNYTCVFLSGVRN